MNDLLDPDSDPAEYRQDLGAIVCPLRLRAAGEAVREVSATHGALCLDIEALPYARQRQVMSVDRLHPGPGGHVLLARAFARLLEAHGGVPIPAPDGTNVAGLIPQLRWLARRPAEVARFVFRSYLAPRDRTKILTAGDLARRSHLADPLRHTV